ncbi:MAG TPA: oligopeptide transporter, OPT family, partial [Chitinophagales bacterium]|nr:oligopeptide transporter, OPT family [Chitinophagales bacterium]
SVLIAGEKGGDFAKPAYIGLAVATGYAVLQHLLHIISETPTWITSQKNKYFPSAQIAGDITPEYLGVGYIIGPKISGVLVAGGVLAWMCLIPLLATLISPDLIALQQVKLAMLKDVLTPGGRGGWNPETHEWGNMAEAIYRAYVRQIGAGAVAAGGFITLLKSIPTIANAFKGGLASMREKGDIVRSRTENDLNFKIVIFGSIALVALMAFLPQIPGTNIFYKLILGLLVIIFGFFFVTVSSRIVGLIGSSNNPISGMTIATIMATALVFIAVGWTGHVYEPMALVVGGMICIAAANAGATSQDLKTGYLVGATPRYQQIALFVGVIVSSLVVGFTVAFLDKPTSDQVAQGITHRIGTEFNAPQATLMATLIKGLLSFNLDWQFVLVGVFIAIVVELCGVKSLSFAVGLYLPLSTTLPIFIGGAIKGFVDYRTTRRGDKQEDAELGRGSLLATGLVAGGALMGVIVAFLQASDGISKWLNTVSREHALSAMLGESGYHLLGVLFFAAMGYILYNTAMKKSETDV